MGPMASLRSKASQSCTTIKKPIFWFHLPLARGTHGVGGAITDLTPEQEAGLIAFEERLDSLLRVMEEISPEKWITLGGEKMAADTMGRLTDEDGGPALEADSKAWTP